MKGIILAAGKGKRMMPLTSKIPKPLIKVNKNPIIEHTLEIMSIFFNKIYIVIGYRGEKIKKRLGNRYNNSKIFYVKQKKLDGTADALWSLKNRIKGKFLVCMGDDLYSKSDIRRCISHNLCILGKEVEGGRFGNMKIDRNNNLISIKKSKKYGKNLACTGLYVLDERIFNYRKVKILNGEYGLPQTIEKMAEKEKVKVVKAKQWIPIGYPNDIKKAEIELNSMK